MTRSSVLYRLKQNCLQLPLEEVEGAECQVWCQSSVDREFQDAWPDESSRNSSERDARRIARDIQAVQALVSQQAQLRSHKKCLEEMTSFRRTAHVTFVQGADRVRLVCVESSRFRLNVGVNQPTNWSWRRPCYPREANDHVVDGADRAAITTSRRGLYVASRLLICLHGRLSSDMRAVTTTNEHTSASTCDIAKRLL